MIDTVTIESPFISEEQATIIENECIIRSGIDLKTGELLYSITTGQLEGSYDSRISIRIMRDKYDYNDNIKKTIKVGCRPYIVIECSLHKAMLGHNIYGGTNDLTGSIRWLFSKIEELINIKLPNFQSWKLRRIDFAEVYDLGSFKGVEEYFKGLNSATFPRRSVNRYGNSGLYSAGSTTAIKFYHKGIEFNKHDRVKLKKFMSDDSLKKLLNYAYNILRVEVEIKTKKLKYDFGEIPYITQITEDYLKRIHDKEVLRLLKEGESSMAIVRKAHDVSNRLYEEYKPAKAGLLLGTWYQLTTLGEDTVKSNMKKATYYRHLKLLKTAGVSWKGTDVVLKKSSVIPEGFSPVRNDPRRVLTIHKNIQKELLKVG